VCTSGREELGGNLVGGDLKALRFASGVDTSRRQVIVVIGNHRDSLGSVDMY
jgi:hypothetical protein